MNQRLLAVLACAALLACGVGHDLEGVSGTDTCTNCHGDAARAGDALAQAAPAGGAHVGHVSRGVACGACHVVPTNGAHSNGAVEVRFSGVATAKGASPTFDGATCSGVYCHGGATHAAASWAGTALACNGCHGAPPASHAAEATACATCHPGTVKPDGTIDVARGLHANGFVEANGGHAPGWAAPAEHGLAAKRDLASCRACHGAGLDGAGGTGPSCASCHAAAGYASWQSNCTFCHGEKTTTYTALRSAAPPRGVEGETATTSTAVGAHQKHLSGGAIGGSVACSECHAVPTGLAHLDGAPAVTFGSGAKRGGAAPAWNGATCASTYCHGATVAGGTNKAPSWTGGPAQAACGTCHGAPPPAPHTTSTACGSCHTGYAAGTVNAALHLNGIVDATSSSHPAGWAAKSQHGYSANRGGLASCKSCHGTDLAGGTSGVSCSACHGSAGFASWQTSCTFCHGDRTSGVASPPVDTQGRTVTTNVSVGVHASHLGTTLMATPACSACHPDRTSSNVVTDAAHVDGNGVAEIAFGALARIGGAAASYTRTSDAAASCASVYCHGKFTGGSSATMSWTSTAQATCTSCHGAPPATGRHGKHSGRSCGECHPGYTSSAVNRTTHVDGAKQVGNRVTSYSATSRSCSTSCHGNETW